MRLHEFSTIQEAHMATLQFLLKELGSSQPILWLVSGGSNVTLEVDVALRLDNKTAQNIVVGLADERYGLPGHKHSNFIHLHKAQFPDDKFSELKSTLVNKSISLVETATYFEQWLNQQLEKRRLILQLGFGVDTHAAGIKPECLDGTRENSIVMYCYGNDFERISIAYETMKRAQSIILYGTGKAKSAIIQEVATQPRAKAVSPLEFVLNLPQTQVFISDEGD